MAGSMMKLTVHQQLFDFYSLMKGDLAFVAVDAAREVLVNLQMLLPLQT